MPRMSAKRCGTAAWKDGLRLVGDPVNVVTGAQTFFETDFRLRGEHIPLSWTRHYDSRRADSDRGVGHGFRLSFDVELQFDLDGMTFIGGDGQAIEFPFLEEDGERVLRGGCILERIGQAHYRVHPPDDVPGWEFHFQRDSAARPSALFYEDNRRPPVRLSYEKGLLAAMQVDASKRVVFEYAGTRLAGAVLLESNSPTKQRLVRYQYDPQGRLVSVEDAYGGTLRYEYDKNNRLSRFTDRRGYSFLHATTTKVAAPTPAVRTASRNTSSSTSRPSD